MKTNHSGPRNVTVTKLSADAAVICWKFPLAARARGYVLRYWRHPASLDDDSTDWPVLELKIIDVEGAAGHVDNV